MANLLMPRTFRLATGKSRVFKSSFQVRRLATVINESPQPTRLPPLPPAKINASSSLKPSLEPAVFKIKDGPTFHGKSFGARSNISAEAVFTTSLVGYPESMSDPSYRGQILVFTQPLIGNYGVPDTNSRDKFGLLKYFESSNLQARGIVVGDVALEYSHWTAVESLSQWCQREGIPAITGVDTRAIVTFLREQGSSLARIDVGEEKYVEDEDEVYEDPAKINLVKSVSTKMPVHIPSKKGSSVTGKPHIALIDCGVKENIIRSIVSRGADVTCLPYDYPIHKVAQYFDGIFISNGPGDPTMCKSTSDNLRKLMNTNTRIPIMGICLGHQLVAIAAGAKTTKMKYGNRAHNIPVMDKVTGRTHITSQNHGYVVDPKSLPSDFREYFTNLNDGSNEGIIHKYLPIFTTQFHPEAKGGPQDTNYLFDAYLDKVQLYKQHHQLNNDVLKAGREISLSPYLLDHVTNSIESISRSQESRRI